MSDQELDLTQVRDAARAWLRVAGIYGQLNGRPCAFIRGLGSMARSVGMTEDEMEAEYHAGRQIPITPYWMGWIARILTVDFGAGLADHQLPVRLLGRFDRTEEYDRGWEDSQIASETILIYEDARDREIAAQNERSDEEYPDEE